MRANGEYESRETGAEREFDEYVQYEDGEGTVICDRRNPSAWIRSSVLRPCRR